MDEQIIEILSNNKLAALAFGAIAGLYIIGRIDAAVETIDPTFDNPDDAIEYHRQKLEFYEQLKQSDMSLEQMVDKLLEEIEELKAELKGKTE